MWVEKVVMERRAIVFSLQYPLPALSDDAVASGEPHPSRRLGRGHWGLAAFASCLTLGASSACCYSSQDVGRRGHTAPLLPAGEGKEASTKRMSGDGCSVEPWSRVLDVAPYHPYSSVKVMP